jgi:hypothetical protein
MPEDPIQIPTFPIFVPIAVVVFSLASLGVLSWLVAPA